MVHGVWISDLFLKESGNKWWERGKCLKGKVPNLVRALGVGNRIGSMGNSPGLRSSLSTGL